MLLVGLHGSGTFCFEEVGPEASKAKYFFVCLCFVRFLRVVALVCPFTTFVLSSAWRLRLMCASDSWNCIMFHRKTLTNDDEMLGWVANARIFLAKVTRILFATTIFLLLSSVKSRSVSQPSISACNSCQHAHSKTMPRSPTQRPQCVFLFSLLLAPVFLLFVSSVTLLPFLRSVLLSAPQQTHIMKRFRGVSQPHFPIQPTFPNLPNQHPSSFRN